LAIGRKYGQSEAVGGRLWNSRQPRIRSGSSPTLDEAKRRYKLSVVAALEHEENRARSGGEYRLPGWRRSKKQVDPDQHLTSILPTAFVKITTLCGLNSNKRRKSDGRI
jgi:hypothetical protein